ncbi:MAG: hypothetical protein ABR572_04090 [Cryomorphaceae bacterium]
MNQLIYVSLLSACLFLQLVQLSAQTSDLDRLSLNELNTSHDRGGDMPLEIDLQSLQKIYAPDQGRVIRGDSVGRPLPDFSANGAAPDSDKEEAPDVMKIKRIPVELSVPDKKQADSILQNDQNR